MFQTGAGTTLVVCSDWLWYYPCCMFQTGTGTTIVVYFRLALVLPLLCVSDWHWYYPCCMFRLALVLPLLYILGWHWYYPCCMFRLALVLPLLYVQTGTGTTLVVYFRLALVLPLLYVQTGTGTTLVVYFRLALVLPLLYILGWHWYYPCCVFQTGTGTTLVVCFRLVLVLPLLYVSDWRWYYPGFCPAGNAMAPDCNDASVVTCRFNTVSYSFTSQDTTREFEYYWGYDWDCPELHKCCDAGFNNGTGICTRAVVPFEGTNVDLLYLTMPGAFHECTLPAFCINSILTKFH